LVIWFSSILSPFILLFAYLTGRYLLFLEVAGLMVVSTLELPKVQAVKDFYVRYLPKYFKSCSLFYTVFPDEKQPTLYAIHPHGIFCLGWSMLYARPEFEHVHFCFSNVLYYSPFFRIICKLTGNSSKCDKTTILNHMRNKRSLALIPGGFEEATIHSNQTDRLFLKNRKGFIKYALQYGYSIVPIYVFGEKNTFSNLQGCWKLRLWLNSFGIPSIFPFGLWFFPVLPKRDEMGIHTVVGAPLQLPAIAQPTKEDVDKWHHQYCVLLKALFDKHKSQVNGGASELELW